MIGKVIVGKSFSGCINYCLKDKILPLKQVAFHNRAEVITFNKCFGNALELSQQFNEVRQLNPKLSKPVLHITLSLAPGEKLDKGTLCKMVEDCAKTFGFENNQFIAVNHLDTKHQHVHIVANRIAFDKKTLSDSNNYKKMAAYCRQMEMKYQLQQVLSPQKFLPKEMRQMPRSDVRKEGIKNDIRHCLLSSKTFDEFEALMKDKSYQVIKGRGIAFIDSKGVYVKGSEVGYSLAKVESILQLSSHEKGALILKSGHNEPFQNQLMRFKESFDATLNKSSTNTSTLIGKIMEDLLNPELTNQYAASELMKLKKKRKRSQHI